MLHLRHSSRKHYFELDLSIQELTNIPQLHGKCYIIISVSNNKIQKDSGSHKVVLREKSGKVSIKDHKCVWNYELTGFQFKLYEDGKTGVLSDKWLTLSFISENENNDKNKLGMLWINLTEYANETKPITDRFLLQDSKINSICKLTLFVKSDPNNKLSPGNYKSKTNNASTNSLTPSSSSIGGHRAPSTKSHSRGSSLDNNPNELTFPVPAPRFNIPERSSQTFQGMNTQSNTTLSASPHSTTSPGLNGNHSTNSFLNRPKSPMSGSHHNTTISSSGGNQNTSNGEQGFLLSDSTLDSLSNNPVLNQFINKTFQFGWQESKDLSYQEFTPAECVQDIIENNGIGWKKDEEGIPYIDRLNINDRPKRLVVARRAHGPQAYSNFLRGASDMYDDDEDEEDDNDDDDDDDDNNDDNDDNNDEESSGFNGYESDESVSSEDIFETSVNPIRKHKANRRLWMSPYNELDIRDNLRSWHVSSCGETTEADTNGHSKQDKN